MARKQAGTFRVGLVLTGVVIIVAAVGLGFYLGKTTEQQKISAKEAHERTLLEPEFIFDPSNEPVVKKDWKTYEIPWGFSIQYPPQLTQTSYEEFGHDGTNKEHHAGGSIVFTESVEGDSSKVIYTLKRIDTTGLSLGFWLRQKKDIDEILCHCSYELYDKTLAGDYETIELRMRNEKDGKEYTEYTAAIMEDDTRALVGTVVLEKPGVVPPEKEALLREMMSTYNVIFL